VVDWPNALMDAIDGGKATEVPQVWTPHVDVFVVPIDVTQKSILAAGETIDAIQTAVECQTPDRGARFVVPLLLNAKEALDDELFQGLMDEMRGRGIPVVEIPYVPALNLAALRRQNLTTVDRRLTRAWWRLLDDVVRVREDQR